MTTLHITFSDEQMAKLKKLSAKRGMSPEDLLRENAVNLLGSEDPDLNEAADYVFAKNAELYKRLA